VAVAFSSRWLVNRWRASEEPGGGGARAVLRRSVAAEVVLAVGVLAASTALSNAVPAIDAVALPFQQSVANAQGIAEFYIDPAKVGDTELHVIVTNADGSVPQIDELTVTLRLPEREVGPIEVEMRRFQNLPNDYWAPAATFPFPGTWAVEARARIGEFEQKVFSVDVTVR
jgi:copper transport protein